MRQEKLRLAFDFSYQLVTRQPKPASLSLQGVKGLVERVSAYFAKGTAKTNITVECTSKAEAVAIALSGR